MRAVRASNSTTFIVGCELASRKHNFLIADLCVRFVRRIAQLSLWAVSLLIYACGSCVE